MGFLAQLVDGSLGMGYGVSSTTFLLGLGLPPAMASAAVHTSEVFASAASGLAHVRFGNVEKSLVWRLAVPGVLGGVLGATLLARLPPERVRPVVTVYLLLMGLAILLRAFRPGREAPTRIPLVPLGLVGGFCDAVGGGGWGPIVTTTLVARGNDVRTTVGSVNTAEFFVTVAQAASFLVLLGLTPGRALVGLVLGSVAAAPIAAHLCRILPRRAMTIGVGVLIVGLSVRTLLMLLS